VDVEVHPSGLLADDDRLGAAPPGQSDLLAFRWRTAVGGGDPRPRPVRSLDGPAQPRLGRLGLLREPDGGEGPDGGGGVVPAHQPVVGGALAAGAARQ
jgi:hypothetical protein